MRTPLARSQLRWRVLLALAGACLSPGAGRTSAAEASPPPPPSEERLVDLYSSWLRDRVGQTVDETAAWLDGWFGNLDYDESHAASGSLRVVPLWVDHQGWDVDVRFRVRVRLPNLNDKIDAVFGYWDPDNFVQDRPITRELSEMSAAREQFRDNSFLAGLGYSALETKNSSLKFGAGVRLRFPIEPYVRARYVRLVPIGRKALLRFQETVYARTQEGQGSVTSLELERVLTEKLLGRASIFYHLSTWDERPEEYGGEISVARALDGKRVIAVSTFIHFEPQNEPVVRDYGARVVYRQRLSGDHLYGELHTGYTWPRYSLDEERRASLNLGVALELKFGPRN